MKLKHYYNLLRGKTKALKPATITFANVKAVIQSYYRKGKLMAGFGIEDHIYEQILWRRTQVMIKSPECWNESQCKVCGCDILGKTMEDRGCSAPDISREECYPAMMTKDVWKTYKTKEKIKLFQ